MSVHLAAEFTHSLLRPSTCDLTQPLPDAVQGGLRRAHSGVQLPGDLGVRQAVGEEQQQVAVAGGEVAQPLPEPASLQPVVDPFGRVLRGARPEPGWSNRAASSCCRRCSSAHSLPTTRARNAASRSGGTRPSSAAWASASCTTSSGSAPAGQRCLASRSSAGRRRRHSCQSTAVLAGRDLLSRMVLTLPRPPPPWPDQIR